MGDTGRDGLGGWRVDMPCAHDADTAKCGGHFVVVVKASRSVGG
jgi:hypothetical protein